MLENARMTIGCIVAKKVCQLSARGRVHMLEDIPVFVDDERFQNFCSDPTEHRKILYSMDRRCAAKSSFCVGN